MHVLCLDLSINDKSLCRPGMLHRTFPYIFSVCVNAVKSEIKAKTQIFYLSVNLFLPSASVVKHLTDLHRPSSTVKLNFNKVLSKTIKFI